MKYYTSAEFDSLYSGLILDIMNPNKPAHTLFKTAFYNKLIDVNSAHNLPRPKQAVKAEKKAFTKEQENCFIEICMKDTIYEPFLVCLLQGIRKGEMLALRPNDFDFDNNILRIDESYLLSYCLPL